MAVTVLWRGTAIQDAAAQAVAPLYIGLPLGTLLAIHGQGGAPLTLMVIGAVVVSDSAQYYTGRAFGRRKLAPVISPKKTVEGAIGGAVFGTVSGVAFAHYWVPSMPVVWAVVMS